jgi:diguanylate cyclase (GGDEF)-like protein/PAS domain S-box-containing protein
MSASEDLYQRFFREAPDAVVVVDEAGIIVDANDRATELFGYPHFELVAQPVEELLPENARERHQQRRLAYLASPTRRPMGAGLELWARARDGRTFPVDVSLSPATFTGGTVVLAAVRDISARRHAERVARQWAELFERAAWGVVISTSDGTRLERMNSAFARMHGYTVDELVGRPLLDVFAPEAHEALAAHLADVETTGHHRFESVHVRKDGSTFPVEIDAILIRDDEGGVRYRAAHVVDITERKRAEDAVYRSQSRFRRVFAAAPFGIALLDAGLRITEANDALSIMLGFDAAALIGRTFGELTPSEDARRFDALGAKLLAGDIADFSIEKRLVSAHGRIVWVDLQASLLDGDGPPHVIVMVADVTTRKQLEADLTHRATHDPLTGLPNRTQLEDRIRHTQARARRNHEYFAILFIDLDGFKTINDRLGHRQGDQALAWIGKRVAAALRPADTVGRVGGDEFVAVCEDLGPDRPTAIATAAAIANRILEDLEPPVELDGATVSIGASIGVLVTHDRRDSPAMLIAAADAAMYTAKASHGEHIAIVDDDRPAPT